MLYAKNKTIPMGGTFMDYIVFGKGDKNLIMIPGLGDGLKSVKGMALPFSILYRRFAREYTVYVFSRPREVPQGITSRDMARELKYGMDRAGIKKAHVLGVSQGGTIAQWLAVDYPEVVDKLVLTVTYPRANDVLNQAIPRWLDFAKTGDHSGLMIDTAEHSYSESYLKAYRIAYPVITKIGKPKSYEKFLNMGEACMTHDCYDRLGEIYAPTLIIGGEQDWIVGAVGSYELAEKIPNCKLFMYPEYGHGLYEEAQDFNDRVLDFLRA